MVQIADMWDYRVKHSKENPGAMKMQTGNVKVLYFATDCMEPYVQVGLLD